MISSHLQNLPTEDIETTGGLESKELDRPGASLTHFQSQFTGGMELRGNAESVIAYLDNHQGWFCRCAQPMAVTPLGERGYVLKVGRYGSLGYEIEPQIGLELLPPDQQGIYRIITVPVPGYNPPNYQVDFRAALQLLETQSEQGEAQEVTRVEWHLNLKVSIQFPRFIAKLPQALIQGAGDRLLRQVVRQISQRLTAKVVADFHAAQGTAPPNLPSQQ